MSVGNTEPGNQGSNQRAVEGSFDAINASERNVTAVHLSPPIRTQLGREVINIDRYVPYFFASINNLLSRGALQRYQKCE